MELRAIIIDDEIDGIKSLKMLVEKYVDRLTIIAETTNPIEGIKFIDNFRPDIVFLDINMPEMSGLDLISKIQYKEFKLIYTTAHEQHALKALKLGTTDYLLKPIDADDLISAINKVKKVLGEKNTTLDLTASLGEVFNKTDKRNKILISDKEITEYCDQDDIIRVEAKSNYSLVVFKDKRSMLVSKTLKEFEKQLCNTTTPFVRVHQSHIINVNHCVRYKREDGGVVEMLDDSHVYLSVQKKEEFLKRINLA